MHGRRGRAEINNAVRRLFWSVSQHRLRHQIGCRFELAQQPFHVVGVIRPAFRIAGVRITRRASREKTAFGGMRARQRAPRNAVAVHVFVATKILARFQFFRSHHLAAVIVACVVPSERFAQALVHANVEIGHHKNRGLQAVCQIERRGRMLKAFVWILREQQHVLGVAMRRVGARDQVGLLGSRGHAGGWSTALHVDDGDRNFSEVRETDELGHQRNAGARRCGEGARAIPASTHHHADGGELVLSLHDGEVVLPRDGVDAERFAVLLKCFWY